MAKISQAKKQQVYDAHGHHCYFCGKTPPKAQMTIDHFIASSQGGDNSISNLVPACRKCNSMKADRSIEWLRMHIGINKSKYAGIISAQQAFELISLGVDLEIPSHFFFFELRKEGGE